MAKLLMGENRLTLRLQTVSVFKMYDRYISQIGRDRRIAIHTYIHVVYFRQKVHR